ncbi:transglutaminase-like cysteine peptidase [Rhizobium alvei]|uniref:Transglutaminase-like cysteine peptidase n=1 Tax=Rhizobium alvei TaxID=1132659 RepID=A0ABT8YRA2_9HYPH|nr:transglutaminase-like cysteine peptidase [Rhizobium alvei]MDO6965842.1 transglutaminase-like cysteine peptidase [Rhizobium alvei]
MKNKVAWKGILAILAATISTVTFAASPNMNTAGKTNPPIGHYEYCMINGNECGSNGSDSGPLQLTEKLWKTILKVNYDANSKIEPLTDQEIFGKEEVWAMPTSVGDCEDYVLLKRKMLMDRGVSPANLLITVVLQPNGDGHAVLTVRTDRGDFVLDNMRNKVLLWSDTEYTFLKRQSTRNAGQWVKIDDDHSPALGAM